MGPPTRVDRQQELVDWTKEARFVFTGVVERAGSLSPAFVPESPETFVIRVERVHRSTPPLSRSADQLVTVRFREPAALSRGKRLVLFTNPILYGEAIALAEVGYVDAPADLNALHELIQGAIQGQADTELADHLAAADAVIQGRVVSVERAPDASPIPLSEHDPDWWVAVIRVQRRLKGDVLDQVSVRYANSRDIRWYRSPKPTPRQDAVWVLHRDGLEVGGIALALVHPLDVRSSEDVEIERVERLLHGGSEPH